MTAPLTSGKYQVNPASTSAGPQYVPATVGMWLDSSDVTYGAAGRPRPFSAEYPLPVASSPAAGSPGTSAATPNYVSDNQSMAYQGVVPLTPGTGGYAPLRSIGFICTAAGPVTLTLADGSTITIGVTVSPAFQSLPFAVTEVMLGAGTAGTFWNLK